MDTPDPYVMLRVRTSPNAKQRTSTKGDDVNPEWNEQFTFYLNPEKKNVLGMPMLLLQIHTIPTIYGHNVQ